MDARKLLQRIANAAESCVRCFDGTSVDQLTCRSLMEALQTYMQVLYRRMRCAASWDCLRCIPKLYVVCVSKCPAAGRSQGQSSCETRLMERGFSHDAGLPSAAEPMLDSCNQTRLATRARYHVTLLANSGEMC